MCMMIMNSSSIGCRANSNLSISAIECTLKEKREEEVYQIPEPRTV